MIWFSVFMFFCEILIPVMMIFIGVFFLKFPPKKINRFYGYRTASSMKSIYTWEFSHIYCGKLLIPFGLMTLFPSLILAVFVFNMPSDITSAVAGVLCVLQIVPIVVAIALTESAINKNFDKSGNRKTE